MAAPVSTYILHFSLYIWATCTGRLDNYLGLDKVVSHLILMKQLDDQGLADDMDRLLREAIVDTVGLDVLFGRFHTVLCDVHASLNALLFTSCVCLLGILTEGRDIDIMPYLIRHHIMNLVVAIVADSRLENGTAPSSMYHNTGILFQ